MQNSNYKNEPIHERNVTLALVTQTIRHNGDKANLIFVNKLQRKSVIGIQNRYFTHKTIDFPKLNLFLTK